MNFIRKYIHIAKEMKPKLSGEACTAISEEYSRLRSQDNTNNDMAKVRTVPKSSGHFIMVTVQNCNSSAVSMTPMFQLLLSCLGHFFFKGTKPSNIPEIYAKMFGRIH